MRAAETDRRGPRHSRCYPRSLRLYTAGCEIISMPGGHFMHREHPQRFISELLRWLAAPR